jgi:NAD(P)-dependent dehydrogenase (short-subunit alcohol dehydrogenase family)
VFDLAGKTALITGGSGGIGQAIVRALHTYGAIVTLSGTRLEPMQEVARALGARAHVVAADLTEPEAIAELVRASVAAMGSIDILVNNAGISHREPTVETADQAWLHVLDVNLTAIFRLTRAVMPSMIARKWGRIINISSILAVTGSPGMGPYAASKAGMIGLTKSLAAEFAEHGVTVNCIAPGYIRTPMMDMNPPEVLEHLLRRIPVGFFGAPDDVAGAVVYLASPAARFITGETVHINGGMAMM